MIANRKLIIMANRTIWKYCAFGLGRAYFFAPRGGALVLVLGRGDL